MNFKELIDNFKENANVDLTSKEEQSELKENFNEGVEQNNMTIDEYKQEVNAASQEIQAKREAGEEPSKEEVNEAAKTYLNSSAKLLGSVFSNFPKDGE
jgi:hypothetical protein